MTPFLQKRCKDILIMWNSKPRANIFFFLQGFNSPCKRKFPRRCL
jgi:hypothetical protein